MNADHRANPAADHTPRPPQRSSLRPITSGIPVTGQQRAAYGGAPASGQQAAPAHPPASGQQPVTSYQPAPGQAPSAAAGGSFAPVAPPATSPQSPAPFGATTAYGQPSTSGPSPVTDQQPATGAGGGFATGAAGVGATAAAGFDKLKDFAARTKEDLTSADDIAASQRKGGPRKVRVLVSRIDPWSALKIGFLLSIALGIMLVVAVYVLWGALNGMGVFVLANEWVLQLFTENQELDLLQFFALNKWMSAAVLVAVVNVVLLTALSTLGAFLYNTISKVVGGFYVTLTDD